MPRRQVAATFEHFPLADCLIEDSKTLDDETPTNLGTIMDDEGGRLFEVAAFKRRDGSYFGQQTYLIDYENGQDGWREDINNLLTNYPQWSLVSVEEIYFEIHTNKLVATLQRDYPDGSLDHLRPPPY